MNDDFEISDDLDALRRVRSEVTTPSLDARDRAQAAWAGEIAVMTQSGSRTRLSGSRRFAARTAIALGVAAALTGGVFLVQRDRIDSVQPGSKVIVSATTPSSKLGPQTFLLVGSDSREFVQNDPAFGQPGVVSGARADTIALVRTDPARHVVALMSIPRDLWVAIPGHGHGKINAAYYFGGVALLTETITKNLEVRINHVVEVDFSGFRKLVDDLGGVKVAFRRPVQDRFSGLSQTTGCHTLDGTEALELARSRYFQYFENGRWNDDGRSDFGRIDRQQLLLRLLGAKVIDRAGLDPVPLLKKLMASLTVDNRLTNTEILRLFDALHHAPDLLTSVLFVEPAARDGQAAFVISRIGRAELDVFNAGTWDGSTEMTLRGYARIPGSPGVVRSSIAHAGTQGAPAPSGPVLDATGGGVVAPC